MLDTLIYAVKKLMRLFSSKSTIISVHRDLIILSDLN